MRLLRHIAASVLVAAQIASAIHADEAGSIDYTLNLVGAPLQQNTQFAKPYPESKASLLYTLSDLSAVAAINPKDGALIWRHSLNATASSEPGSLSIGSGQEIVYTGAGDSVTAWSAIDGRLIWQRSFPGCRVRHVRALDLPGETASIEKDVVAVLDGEQNAVYRLSSRSGSDVWKYHDASSDSLFATAATGGRVSVMSLRSSMLKGQKLRVAVLDATNGKSSESISPSSEDLSSPSDIIGLRVAGSVPLLAWSDTSKSVVKINTVGTKNVATFDVKAKDKVERISLHASSEPSAKPHFLIQYQTAKKHWAQVFHIDPKSGKTTKAYDLPETEGPGSYAASSINGVVYFTHTTLTETKLHISTSQKHVARFTSKQALTPTSVDSDSNIRLEHSAADVVEKSDGSFAVRSAVYLESGHWSLVQNGQTSWTRPEMLAGLVKAEWVETAQTEALLEELEAETRADGVLASVHRFVRHANDVRQAFASAHLLPEMLQSWVTSFIGIEGASPSTKAKTFGFNKQIIGATRQGDIVLVDPSSVDKVVSQWKDAEYAQTGKSAWNASSVGSLNGKLAQHLRLPPTGKSEGSTAPSTSRVTYEVVDNGLQGLYQGKTIWKFSPRKDQKLLGVTRALVDEPVASIGRVLGDRRVHYKYLNPNVVLVKTAHEETGQLTVSVVDAVSGNVLYSATHADVDLSRPLADLVTENWFAYSFSVDAGKEEAGSCGNQLIVGELYESELPNDRGPLAALTNYSSLSPASGTQGSMKPFVYTHSYVVPEEISRMAVTQTERGITSRQLLVYLPGTGSIVGLPHGVLDPRRPVGKDPSRQEQEEGLVRYHPFIDFDAKWHLTHNNVVKGIREIITTPSVMESTSLVFAYGDLDIFGTRVTPSFSFDILSNSFNKAQLLLTVIGLTAATFAVVPFVQRKQTNALWQV